MHVEFGTIQELHIVIIVYINLQRILLIYSVYIMDIVVEIHHKTLINNQ